MKTNYRKDGLRQAQAAQDRCEAKLTTNPRTCIVPRRGLTALGSIAAMLGVMLIMCVVGMAEQGTATHAHMAAVASLGLVAVAVGARATREEDAE